MSAINGPAAAALAAAWRDLSPGAFAGFDVEVAWGVGRAELLILLDDLLAEGGFELIGPDEVQGNTATRAVFAAAPGVTLNGRRVVAIQRRPAASATK